MDPASSRAYVVASYLLGLRGDALLAALPPTVCQANTQLVTALSSAERDTRARWLAGGLRDLVNELEQRAVTL
jgi:hypothetical protein